MKGMPGGRLRKEVALKPGIERERIEKKKEEEEEGGGREERRLNPPDTLHPSPFNECTSSSATPRLGKGCTPGLKPCVPFRKGCDCISPVHGRHRSTRKLRMPSQGRD